MKNNLLLTGLILLSTLFCLQAQEESYEEEEEFVTEDDFLMDQEELDYELQEEFEEIEEEILSEAEFAIPSAPAFSLMGITPEMVPRPGIVRDFKVDWRIRDYKGAPDLALEAMPIWILFYNNDDLSKYRNASSFARMLSTLSFSLSTASFNNTNHLGYALKLNLYRDRDPLNDVSILEQFQKEVKAESFDANQELIELEAAYVEAASNEDRREIRRQIRQLKSSKKTILQSKREQLEYIRQDYLTANWNATMLDIAFGKIYTFDQDIIDSVGINNQGYGVWLNGGIRSGKNGFLSGIIKLSEYGEVQSFQAGLSLRYGNPKYNFYLETMYEHTTETVDPEFDPFTIKENTYRLSYGGDFRLSRGILLNFSLQTKFDQDMRFRDFIPVANLTCLMR